MRQRAVGTSGAEVEPRWRGETVVAGFAGRLLKKQGSSDG